MFPGGNYFYLILIVLQSSSLSMLKFLEGARLEYTLCWGIVLFTYI
jgi:hypothetical protein